MLLLLLGQRRSLLLLLGQRRSLLLLLLAPWCWLPPLCSLSLLFLLLGLENVVSCSFQTATARI